MSHAHALFKTIADLFNNFETLLCIKLRILSLHFLVTKNLCHCALSVLHISGNSKVFQIKVRVVL